MIKILIVLVAIVLIAFIIWWFFGKHEQAAGNAIQKGDAQEATITVKGGYSPATLVLKKGVPAKVHFDMQDSTACLSHVVFDKLGLDKDLTKQKITTIDIPTDESKEFDYACGMNMFHGKIIVK